MSEILLDVQPSPSSGNLRPSLPTMPEDFHRRAGEIADSVGEIADEFRARLEQRVVNTASGTGWALREVELSFQLAVQAEAGVVITKASAGATFAAKIVWKKDS